ncbi:hypothetical protein P7K49_005991, partial [Saguinus oedipus]
QPLTFQCGVDTWLSASPPPQGWGSPSTRWPLGDSCSSKTNNASPWGFTCPSLASPVTGQGRLSSHSRRKSESNVVPET